MCTMIIKSKYTPVYSFLEELVDVQKNTRIEIGSQLHLLRPKHDLQPASSSVFVWRAQKMPANVKRKTIVVDYVEG